LSAQGRLGSVRRRGGAPVWTVLIDRADSVGKAFLAELERKFR
jgi:hypothetical protein